MLSTGFVFPGQGSQSIGMLKELADVHSGVTKVFSQVSEHLGYDLWNLVQQGPEDRLNQTEYTQVAMLTADVAVFTVMQEQQTISASMMAGHSLGEYAALVCAGAINLPDAAALVAKRGQLMQETVPLGQGEMAAIIGLSDEQVLEICEQASSDTELVTPANYNAIGQVVIAGHRHAVEKAIALALDSDARMAKIIPVSVPCHCPLLKDASNLFVESLQNTKIKAPTVPVISNVDLSIYETPEQIRTLLKEQLYRPVRWVETIQLMKQKGIDRIIECGPGKTLSGLIKRIDKSLPAVSVYDQISLKNALESYNH